MSLLSATRDANNGTWYVLQYATDFRPRSGTGIRPWMSPVIDGSLFHDDSRHVLELLPKKPAVEREPWPGLAVDIDGRVYRVDAENGRVLVQCGGHTRELVCESGALGAAAGLALDRRGLLYIADPPAHRVLVVNPDDGSLAGVLAGGLDEPVDVAAAPDGRVFVADRRGGRIVAFNSRFDRVGAFAPTDADGVIVTPRPIAVMVDEDGAVLVADGNFPRLLRFAPAGTRLGDAEPEAVLQAISPPRPVIDALERAYGKTMPRFLAGSCGPCRPDRDGGERLAEVHRALRLIRLKLGHAYPACGTFVSAALDGGAPGTSWHHIVIDADVPEGTWIKVQTVSADNPELLNVPAALPSVAEHDNLLELAGPTFVPFEEASCSSAPRMPDTVPDRLVFSPPGRYLRVRVTLGSDGEATPSLRAIRVFYPRASYLDLLPRVFRRDPESAFFLEHFLALFEHVFTGVEDRYERFTRELNPGAAPLDVLNWLGGLVDLCFDPSWPIERRRALVLAAMELFALRGTPRGL
ncbi:MAG: phage tail protein, partial [Vicinamibacterales bacterium]